MSLHFSSKANRMMKTLLNEKNNRVGLNPRLNASDRTTHSRVDEHFSHSDNVPRSLKGFECRRVQTTQLISKSFWKGHFTFLIKSQAMGIFQLNFITTIRK